MGLKSSTQPRKKPTTVTRQLTKSRDFRQNYLCDFHLRDHQLRSDRELREDHVAQELPHHILRQFHLW
jgi:hypothetical protein